MRLLGFEFGEFLFVRYLVVLILSLFNNSCSKNDISNISGVSQEWKSVEDRNFWIAKAVRTLSAGQSASLARVRELANLDDEGVVDEIIKHPDFGDGALDFALFYLQYQSRTLYDDVGIDGQKTYSSDVRSKPSAITAAQAVYLEKNFFEMLSESQPLWFGQFVASTEQSRAEAKRTLFNNLDTFRMKFGTDGLNKKEGCSSPERNQIFGWIPEYGSAVAGPAAFEEMFGQLIRMNIQMEIACQDSSKTGLDVLAILNQITRTVDIVEKLAEEHQPDQYSPKNITEFKNYESDFSETLFSSEAFSVRGFWFQHPNSSTNLNRKRAAYALQTFFCDDLTPLNIIADNGNHGEGQHGEDPSCRSCHYKLDPMAGFFSEIGLIGVKFKRGSVPFHTFDDNATIFGEALEKYHSSWKKIGFVRSSVDDSLNDLISNEEPNRLGKLFEVVRKAPEAKSCLVRRLAEYVLGQEQSFDGAWLAEFEKRLKDESTSGAAVKTIFKDLVLSRTFKTRDPRSDECYDYAGGEEMQKGIPCEVSYLIDKNCVSCHRTADAENGNLGLSEWVPSSLHEIDENLSTFNFKHIDASGRQIPKTATFKEILRRINSSDADESMPLGQEMPAVEKVRLFKWLESNLQE